MGELVTVQVCEGMSRGVAVDAGARIAAAIQGADALVESLRVRVGLVGAATVLAQVNAEVDGRRIRVQEAAADLGEALDRLADGLRARVAAVTAGWAPRPWPRRPRGRVLLAGVPAQGRGLPVQGRSLPVQGAVPDGRGAGPVAVARGGEWRADRTAVAVGAARTVAHPCTEVPWAETPQRIARRKWATPVWCSPDAAARTMDAMDFDIHLFTDPATETDAVVYRVGPTGYRLARTAAAGPPTCPAVPLTLHPCGAPELTEGQAVERLSAADLPFLFFAQPGTHRGRVLYRRFDGRLGLIAAVS